MAPRRFKPMKMDFVSFNPQAAGELQGADGGDVADSGFINGNTLSARVFSGQDLLPEAPRFRGSENLYFHIDLLKAFLLAGAKQSHVSDSQFLEDFMACFVKGTEIFKVDKKYGQYNAKKDVYEYMTIIKAKTLVQFHGKGLTEDDAYLNAINAFRAKMETIYHMLDVFVKFYHENPNYEPAGNPLLENWMKIRAETMVKISNIVNLPGLCNFELRSREFFDYLHYFAYKMQELNP